MTQKYYKKHRTKTNHIEHRERSLNFLCGNSVFFVVLVCAAMLLVFPMNAWAQSVSVRASVSHSQVPQNTRLELNIEIQGTQHVKAPAVELDHFITRYIGPSTRISMINGRMSSSITHVYHLTPQKEGTFTIAPIAVQVGSKVFQTDAIEVTVLSASSSPVLVPSQPEGSSQASIGDTLQLILRIDEARLYLNQSTPIRIQLLVGNLEVRDIKMPILTADGFLMKQLMQPTRSRVLVNGEPYTLLEFSTVITPIRTGSLKLGPASVMCRVVQRLPPGRRLRSPFAQFFGQNQLISVKVEATPVSITVLPLPDENKPETFEGAVGTFTLDVEAVPKELSAGEPVTLTMAIRGLGNFESVQSPVISGDLSLFKVYEPQLKNAQGSNKDNQKIYEQVLIPLDESVEHIPPISLSYFDPNIGSYQTARHAAIVLKVTPQATQEHPRLVGVPSGSTYISQPEVLGRDIVYIKEKLGKLRPSGWNATQSFRWGFSIGIPIFLLLISEALRRRRDRLIANPATVRASGAMKRSLKQINRAQQFLESKDIAAFYAEIHKVLQFYIGDRFNLVSEGLTAVELKQSLCPREVPEEILNDIIDLFDRCDAVRFAPSTSASTQMESTLSQTQQLLRKLDQWNPK